MSAALLSIPIGGVLIKGLDEISQPLDPTDLIRRGFTPLSEP